MRNVARLSILAGGAAAVLLGLLAPDASLLPGLLFWVALVQGLIALAAIATLCKGKWFEPVRTTILDLHPMLLLFPVAFLAFSRNLGVYDWTAHPTAWLSPGFFVVRNVLMLLITWLLAWRLAAAVRREASSAGLLAVLYALAFVINQSLIAFDWVMSFEFPWVSTLFGGYFFIEALYGAIAVTAIMALVLAARGEVERRGMVRDTAMLLFGFSLLWAGQFFAQYLVIWYGNLPHEQSFLVKRLIDSPLRELSVATLLMLFGIPFVVLLPPESKVTPAIVGPITLIVLGGIFVERLVFLLPVTELNPVLVALGFVVVGLPCFLLLRSGLQRGARETASPA